MAMSDYNNSPSGIPTDKVLQMRGQGLSNNQIIQNLQREGYIQTQIFDAMNQAEVKVGVEQVPPAGLISPPPANPMTMGSPPPGPGLAYQSSQTTPGYSSSAMQGFSQSMDRGMQDQGTVTTEELIEALIDEKWEDFVKDVNKIIEWKDKSEDRISKLEQQFDDLKNNFDKLHKAVVGKIGEYDKHILDVGAEIQAMEKVFQKVLPTFTDNVKELSKITDSIRRR